MSNQNHEADRLDALLEGRVRGAPHDPRRALLPHEHLATRLVELAAEAQPDPAFVEALGARLQTAARQRHARARPRLHRLALLAASLLLILLGMLVVPSVRAAVLKTLRIGVVEIEAPERPAPTGTAVNRVATPPALPPVLDHLAGATTLAQARRDAAFPLRLPTYPADLGPPDLVYQQDLGGDALILVWLDPQHPQQVRMALAILSSNVLARKSEVIAVEETQVAGRRAAWVSGDHLLQVVGASGTPTLAPHRLVTGNVLIWEANGLTYRLESSLPRDEAIRVAESLKD